jgi:hypothetical protein
MAGRFSALRFGCTLREIHEEEEEEKKTNVQTKLRIFLVKKTSPTSI